MAGENAELDKYINDLSDIKEEPDVNNVNDVVDDNDDTDAGDDNSNARVEDNNASAEQAAQDESQQQQSTGQEQKDTGKKDKQSGKGKKSAEPEQLRPVGDGAFADSKGNIVDKDGKLIASSGFAARMYNTNRRLKAQLDDQTQQLNQVSRAVGEVQALARSIQSYGLDNDETAQALDMAGRLKRGDVISVAKDVLAIIAARGYNVTDLLGGEVGDSLEMRAMQRMLDERLAPITRAEQASQQQTQAQQAGVAAYNRFINDNEFADVHANDIVQLMQREGVNPQTAYNRIYRFAVANGLDFSQPLGPQVQARQQQMRSSQQQQQQQNRQQKPMPNGATTRRAGAVPQIPLASADDDWGTIISQVQKTIDGVH